jgi:hypothetical protein
MGQPHLKFSCESCETEGLVFYHALEVGLWARERVARIAID